MNRDFASVKRINGFLEGGDMEVWRQGRCWIEQSLTKLRHAVRPLVVVTDRFPLLVSVRLPSHEAVKDVFVRC